MMKINRSYIVAAAMTVSFFLISASSAFAGNSGAAGIVAAIEKAPVIADGDVTGKGADFVITLAGSQDPAVPGRGMLAGQLIKVFLPDDFDLENLDPAFPLADVPTPFPPTPPLPPMPCLPANLQCTTAVILSGWPQEPLFPPVLFHTLSIDPDENSFVFTAAQDIVPNSPEFPGIKQLHLILHGVSNPPPGRYQIRVEAQTGPDGAWETGSGILRVFNNNRPSINVTSVFVKALAGTLPESEGPACGPGTNPPNPDNPIFQTTSVGTEAPFIWTFLLWGRDNEALDEVAATRAGPNHWRLKRERQTIGHIFVDAPRGAVGHDIQVNPVGCPTMLAGAPVIAGTPGVGPQPVGRLDLQFIAGSVAGDYTTTVLLNRGNEVQMVVTAE